MSDLPTESTRSPVGKIGRLPFAVRMEVNRRLADGQTGPVILEWLNALPEVRAVLAAQFEGQEINAQNLSAWRQGQFRRWLDEREEIEDMKALTKFLHDLAEASGSEITDGALALTTGRLIAKVQTLGEESDTDELAQAARAIASLATSTAGQRKVKLDERKTAQKDKELELAERKFRVATCEAFLKWDKDNEVRRILASDAPRAVKLDELHRRLFGTRPEAETETGEGA